MPASQPALPPRRSASPASTIPPSRASIACAAGMLIVSTVAACASDGGDDHRGRPVGGKADSSLQAVFLDLEFEGEALAYHTTDTEQKIKSQLLYTIGQLNWENSVSRMDRLELFDVTATQNVPGGWVYISYRARLPVAWGEPDRIPDSYDFELPRDVTSGGLERFTDLYGKRCVEWDAHDVVPANMWFYYRPQRSTCQFNQDDTVTISATVSPSTIGTTGKFPEYHKVWEDDVLRVVAIFGKYKWGATSDDLGISMYATFARLMRDELQDLQLTTVPSPFPYPVRADTPEVQLNATLADGRRVEVVALLVDSISSAGPDFNARYAELTRSADLIAYNGHSAMGANIRALARLGEWETGQYAVVFMNGCDTYAYVDRALFDAHAEVNPDDPEGTKHLDIVTNAMPTWFRSMPDATMALVRGLMAYDQPRTYEHVFAYIDPRQVVLVSGEQDNEFVPGDGQGDPAAWAGLFEQGIVAAGEEAHFETPVLDAGRYTVEMNGTGDADLYVRVGEPPTETLYDCRPYANGTDELCEAEIPVPAALHIMVRGYAESSTFGLVGLPAD